jgi:hypothetical protein
MRELGEAELPRGRRVIPNRMRQKIAAAINL